MADLISYKLGISLDDTNLLISVAGNIRIGQASGDTGLSYYIDVVVGSIDINRDFYDLVVLLT